MKTLGDMLRFNIVSGMKLETTAGIFDMKTAVRFTRTMGVNLLCSIS